MHAHRPEPIASAIILPQYLTRAPYSRAKPRYEKVRTPILSNFILSALSFNNREKHANRYIIRRDNTFIPLYTGRRDVALIISR
jgi:hypothetical protein